MSLTSFGYYLLWLVAVLLVVGVVCARLTGRLRRRELQQERSFELADALSRYAMWLASLRGPAGFELQRELADTALEDASRLQGECFPELAPELGRLMQADAVLQRFLLEQQQLRTQDPEAWLECDGERLSRPATQDLLDVLDAVSCKLAALVGDRASLVHPA